MYTVTTRYMNEDTEVILGIYERLAPAKRRVNRFVQQQLTIHDNIQVSREEGKVFIQYNFVAYHPTVIVSIKSK